VFERRANMARFLSSFRVHQPFQGEATCPAGAQYKAQVAEQHTKEIDTVQHLTGWSAGEIAQRSR
jgi:hypothetical protein